MSRTSEPDFELGTLNAYCIRPDEVQPGDRYGYKVVVVVDNYVPQWCAYKGPTSWTDEKVSEYGDALTEKEACVLFPSIAASGRNYRN